MGRVASLAARFAMATIVNTNDAQIGGLQGRDTGQ